MKRFWSFLFSFCLPATLFSAQAAEQKQAAARTTVHFKNLFGKRDTFSLDNIEPTDKLQDIKKKVFEHVDGYPLPPDFQIIAYKKQNGGTEFLNATTQFQNIPSCRSELQVGANNFDLWLILLDPEGNNKEKANTLTNWFDTLDGVKERIINSARTVPYWTQKYKHLTSAAIRRIYYMDHGQQKLITPETYRDYLCAYIQDPQNEDLMFYIEVAPLITKEVLIAADISEALGCGEAKQSVFISFVGTEKMGALRAKVANQLGKSTEALKEYVLARSTGVNKYECLDDDNQMYDAYGVLDVATLYLKKRKAVLPLMQDKTEKKAPPKAIVLNLRFDQGDRRTLTVPYVYTVFALKRDIFSHFWHVPAPKYQALTYCQGAEFQDENKQQLGKDEGRRLNGYESLENFWQLDTPDQVIWVSNAQFTLFIRSLRGGYAALQKVTATTTIRQIKHAAAQQVPEWVVEQQKLAFAGNELEDDKTCEDYDIGEENVLLMTLTSEQRGQKGDSVVIEDSDNDPNNTAWSGQQKTIILSGAGGVVIVVWGIKKLRTTRRADKAVTNRELHSTYERVHGESGLV